MSATPQNHLTSSHLVSFRFVRFKANSGASKAAQAETIQWYPRGGFQRVPASLQRIAESHGAKFHFSSPVRSVLRDEISGRAKGIQLESGQIKEADVVVVNADLVWAYNNLFTHPNSEEAGEENGKEGKGAATVVKEEVKRLLDPRRAKRLLGKPHS